MRPAFNKKLHVNPLGGKIEIFLHGILVLGTFMRGDGKQGITHPCTPIFGPDRKNLYGLKQHGNMRNEETEVREEDGKTIVSHLITDPGYPAGMKVEQILQVSENEFKLQMTHTNTGDKQAAVNAGEHCYFDAPQGFEGTLINGEDITELIKNNYDGIAIDLKETNIIHIPGKPAYELKQQGLKKAVVWVGKNPETKTIDQTYICIEPVEDDPFSDFFGSPASMIAPGDKRTVQFRLAITSNIMPYLGNS